MGRGEVRLDVLAWAFIAAFVAVLLLLAGAGAFAVPAALVVALAGYALVRVG